MLRRARLETRFRASARPVTLEEFMLRIWPAANEKDLALMRRWAQLREAWSLLNGGNFRGYEIELKRVFEKLDEKGEGSVQAREIVRAQILSKEDVQRLTRSRDMKQWLDMETFRAYLGPT